MAQLQLNEISPDFLQRIGLIATRWSLLEAWLTKWLAFLTGGNEAKMGVVSGPMGPSALITAVQLLMKQRFGESLGDAGFTLFFERLEAAKANRNAWVHGLWLPSAQVGIANVQTLRWSRKIPLQEEDVSLAQLDHFAEEISTLIVEVIHALDQATRVSKGGELKDGHGAT